MNAAGGVCVLIHRGRGGRGKGLLQLEKHGSENEVFGGILLPPRFFGKSVTSHIWFPARGGGGLRRARLRGLRRGGLRDRLIVLLRGRHLDAVRREARGLGVGVNGPTPRGKKRFPFFWGYRKFLLVPEAPRENRE